MKFSYITKKLDERNLKIFEDIVFEKKEKASSYSLKPLMKMLKEYYNKNVILLIDEFDAPLVKGHKKGKYKDIYHLLDGFYEEILKGNEYLKFAVITGVENFIFNGINNTHSYSVVDKKYSEYFGLTEKEIDKILIDFDLVDSKKEIEKWYGGYLYGENKIYNIWSILKFLAHKDELKIYWQEGGSENYFIKYMLKNSSYNYFLETLDRNEILEVNYKDALTEVDIETGSAFFTSMISRGFLTIDKKISYSNYTVKIPNQEVKKSFRKLFINPFE